MDGMDGVGYRAPYGALQVGRVYTKLPQTTDLSKQHSYNEVTCLTVNNMRATEWAVVIEILACFPISRGFNPPHRGALAPPRATTNPNLVEGDMAVPESQRGTGLAPEAFIKERTHLWPQGLVHYRYETFEWDGLVEPVFSDSQLENITQARNQIMIDVPCIKFV